MKRVLVLGANSAIARGAIKAYVARGDRVFLVARNKNALDQWTSELGPVGKYVADLDRTELHEEILNKAREYLGGFDIALIAYGHLGANLHPDKNPNEAIEILHTNLVSPVSFLVHLAKYFETQGGGSIAVIGSIAGDRASSLYASYRSAKAGLDIYCKSLRQRLHPKGVNVLFIKPGPIDTPMIQHLKRKWYWADAEQTGRQIVRAIDRKCATVYLPWFWKWVMMGLRLVPESLARRLKPMQ